MMQVMNSTAALALQEVHGSEAGLCHEIHLSHKTAACFASVPNRGAGGVALLIPGLSPNEAADPDRFRRSEPISGRVQRLQIKSDVAGAGEGALPNMIAIYNARNFQLTAEQVQRTRGSIRAELSIAEQQPEQATALATGDFKFMDEAPLEMTAPLVNEGLPRRRNHRPERQLPWEQALGDMVELDPELPTHYTVRSQQCARIDKIYISSLPWLLIQWRAKVDTPAAPDTLFDRARAPEDAEPQPIPQYIFEGPLFTKYFDLLSDAADVVNHPPSIRLKEFKRLIREAARVTRNDLT
ncbi:unnamed protein product, partial [Prorocentrum cordatum]